MVVGSVADIAEDIEEDGYDGVSLARLTSALCSTSHAPFPLSERYFNLKTSKPLPIQSFTSLDPLIRYARTRMFMQHG